MESLKLLSLILNLLVKMSKVNLMKNRSTLARSAVVSSEKVSLKIDWCSHEAAKYA